MRLIEEKRFAAGANRDQMATCKDFGIEMEDFLRLGLEAMQSIAGDLGYSETTDGHR